jgi:hypothetical protein
MSNADHQMSSDMNLQIGSKVRIRSGSGNDPYKTYKPQYKSKDKKIAMLDLTNSGDRLPDVIPTSSAVTPITDKRVVDRGLISVTVNDETNEPSGDVSADSNSE